jgi:hypothetical protein
MLGQDNWDRNAWRDSQDRTAMPGKPENVGRYREDKKERTEWPEHDRMTEQLRQDN